MKILFVASEMAPFAKTGGLGDVVGSLPKVLRAKGIDARVVMPHYGMINSLTPHSTYRVPRRQGEGDAHVHTTESDGVPVYFLKSWPYFVDDNKIYSDYDWDMPRFIYFCQMAAAFIWEMGRRENWWPDVVHVHDWHTGLLPFLIHEARFNAGWQDVATVMTIHNMAFQGPSVGRWLWEEGFNNRDHYALPTQWHKDNLLGIGIAYANKITTVSPRHAIELHYPRFGEGLEGVVWARNPDFVGILNGLDTERFNPATDPHIAQHYDADTFREKRIANKLALQAELGLEQNPDIPLIGLISRLTDQKGIDFAIPAVRHYMETAEVQFVGLGLGDPALEAGLRQLEHDYFWKARARLEQNVVLAQKIYAGADMLLVPSRYEPCGLTQMLAMRYGCLPVVRETGGLADTVENYDDQQGDAGTGFKFLFEESAALIGTMGWALDTLINRHEAWQRMQERAMRHDWSWSQSADQYIDTYQKAVAQKRAWRTSPKR